MSDLVRVRASGREFNTGRARAEAQRLEVLDEPTHRRDGTPRPVTRAGGRPNKPRTTVPSWSAEREFPAQEAAPEPADDSDTENEE